LDLKHNAMYEIRFKGAKAKKDFKLLLKKYSKNIKKRLRYTLENNPYPSSTHGTNLNKVEKKGQLYCYPMSGGDRILFDIIELENNQKVILIHYSGNDDGEIRYLRRHS